MSLIEKIFGRTEPSSPVRSVGSAAVARERLQIILAHERGDNNEAAPDYLPALQAELMQVISKYIRISQEDIKVQFERQNKFEVLEVNIILPEK